MLQGQENVLPQYAAQFLVRNYDYLWLKTMLDKCASAPSGSTLIVGSSHALNGIWEGAWTHAVNCSMHSQDIYYDSLCARRAILSAGERHPFKRCFIVMGYYIAFQDLSSSTIMRESVITNVYYPIFRDAHNWSTPIEKDLWEGAAGLSDALKGLCEKAAAQKILELGTYYSKIRRRGSFFDLKGRTWAQVPEDERRAMGQFRAESHNKSFQHKKSFSENQKIFQELIRFLYAHNVLPIVVITPFTDAYNHYVLPEMKEAVLNMLDSVPEDVHYIDFNQSTLFGPSDFMDTDHLNAKGAETVSRILAELFGE